MAVQGKLYLIPTLLGNTPAENVLPKGTIDVLRRIRYFVVENTRTTRRVLSRLTMETPIDDIVFIELDKHDPRHLNVMELLGPVFSGSDMALMSEADTPCVADPGAFVVELAHQAGVEVVPLTGPNAMILALMASGFNGQSFRFHGYLPIKADERAAAIRNLERLSMSGNETELFIETPFRNNAMLADLLKHLHKSTMLCVAYNLTTADEKIVSKSVGEWKSVNFDWNKKPAVFLVYAQPQVRRR